MRSVRAGGWRVEPGRRTRCASCCALGGSRPPAPNRRAGGAREPMSAGMSDQRPSSARAAAEVPRELLEYLAEGLVEEPDRVSVELFEGDDGTIVLELSVAPDDYGKVIGRGGRTAQALRTVVKAAATGEGCDVVVDIVD